MEIKIIKEKISEEELQKIAEQGFGTIVKLAVDIEKELIALGCQWHSECQEALVEDGSEAQDVWGCNIDIESPRENRLEYASLINIKPFFGHKKMEIIDAVLKEKIKQIVDKLIE